MKKIQFPTYAAIGNSPIFANTGDINYIDEQITELSDIIGQTLADGQPLVRINGAQWSTNILGSGDTEYTVTDGWIWADGELFTVVATTVTVPSGSTNIPLWTIAETYPTGSGHDVNIGGTINTFNVRIIRELVPVVGPSGGSGVGDYVCDYNEVDENPLSGEWSYITGASFQSLLEFDNISAPAYTTSSPPSNAARQNVLAYKKTGKTLTIALRAKILFSPNSGHTCDFINLTLPNALAANSKFPLVGSCGVYDSHSGNLNICQYSLFAYQDKIEIVTNPISLNSSGTIELFLPLTSIHLA